VDFRVQFGGERQTVEGHNMSRKRTPRQVIARSYPSWDYAMADRLIAWLDECGYEIVEKGTSHQDASLVPATSDTEEQPKLARADH